MTAGEQARYNDLKHRLNVLRERLPVEDFSWFKRQYQIKRLVNRARARNHWKSKMIPDMVRHSSSYA